MTSIAPCSTEVVPAPAVLRPDLIRRIESLPDEDLRFVHEVMLHAEKHRLWREISQEAAAEHSAGSWGDVAALVAEVRALRKAS